MIKEKAFFPQQKEMQKSEKQKVLELNREEQEALFIRANIREKQFNLKRDLRALGKGAQEEANADIVKAVHQEMTGEALAEASLEKLIEEADKLRDKAERAKNLFPNQAAYLYAKAAKLELSMGNDGRDEMAKANKLIEESKELPKTNPSSLLPEAVMLGIEKLMSSRLSLPKTEKIAAACAKNEEILQKYALILPEAERENFLEKFEEQERQQASVILDHSASEYLPEEFAKSKEEKSQRQAILKRAGQALEETIVKSETEGEAGLPLLCDTLVRLKGDDGLRKLQNAGAKGLSKAKDPEQQARRYEYMGLVAKTLLGQDKAKGGALGVKLLGKKDLPPHLFQSVFEGLLNKQVLTAKAEEYFSEKGNWPFLKKLIAQYPNQFNTVIDTLTEIKDYNPAENEGEVFGALSDLDAITPIIFDRYRNADAKGKKELAQKIKELKPKFFRNEPIRDVLAKEDRKILAEMVYLAYQPVGMSFSSVEKLLERLRDHTDDLEGFEFPKDGYPFVMEQGKRFALKPGERLDEAKLKNYRELFGGKAPQTDEEVGEFSKLLGRIAKAGSDFKSKDMSTLLGIFGADQAVRNFLERSRNLTPAKHYSYLNELKELLGVYFSDNYNERLKNFLAANPKAESRILKILSSPKRQDILKKKLAKDGKGLNWDEIDSRDEAADALSIFIQTKVLKIAREEIAKMSNKFVESEAGEEAQAGKGELKAHVSKNVGSFFAKASAGICTAQDIPLFEREDHFHINIVEGDEDVRGNIQAYIIKEPDGKKSLVLRGFNPNSAFLEKINPGAFSEAVLRVGKQFQKDNGLAHLYITEHLSGYHALSNRPPVANYLQKKYVKEKAKKQFNLKIASGTSVNNIYEI